MGSRTQSSLFAGLWTDNAILDRVRLNSIGSIYCGSAVVVQQVGNKSDEWSLSLKVLSHRMRCHVH